MLEFRPRLWASLGLVAALGVGVTACGGEGGQGAGEAGTPHASANASGGASAGEAAAGEGGGEGGAAGESGAGESGAGESGAGEAGASAAYAGIPEASRDALRVAQLTGFFEIARKVADAGDPAAAAILVDQGLLEVAQAFPQPFACCAGAELTAAYQALSAAWTAGKPTAEIAPMVARAEALGAEAVSKAGGTPQDVVRGLLQIASGLYALVVTPDGVDPIEYQHAQGAALAAKAVFNQARPNLDAADPARTADAAARLDALLALFPAATVPDSPAPVAQVAATVSRAELALSGIR